MADTGHEEEASTAPCALRLDPGAVRIDLGEMARRPLPGGVAAVAAAAAMGAALMAKAVRLALRYRREEDTPQAGMEDLAARAVRDATALLDLVGADSLAYRSVLDTRGIPAYEPERHRAWLAASEVPLRAAELALPLEKRIPALMDRCPPVARLDLQVAASLLHAASEGGMLAAEANLGESEESDESGLLRLRVAALREGQGD